MTDNPHGLARGATDGETVFVGDKVMVSGEVMRSIAGVGALVRFTSKTEDWEGWIRESDLRYTVGGRDLPPEPGDGTWLLVYVDDNPRIFHRDDAEGHGDRGIRRFDRHWWDVVAEQWIDWPAAVLRGAARTGVRQMTAEDEGS